MGGSKNTQWSKPRFYSLCGFCLLLCKEFPGLSHLPGKGSWPAERRVTVLPHTAQRSTEQNVNETRRDGTTGRSRVKHSALYSRTTVYDVARRLSSCNRTVQCIVERKNAAEILYAFLLCGPRFWHKMRNSSHSFTVRLYVRPRNSVLSLAILTAGLVSSVQL